MAIASAGPRRPKSDQGLDLIQILTQCPRYYKPYFPLLCRFLGLEALCRMRLADFAAAETGGLIGRPDVHICGEEPC